MNKPKVKVKKTTDLSLVKALHTICFPDDHFAGETNTVWWVGFDGSQPACFAGLNVFSEGSKKCGFLIRAGVQPNYRGQGLQSTLIKIREREAKRLGISTLITYTVVENTASSNNLIQGGFKLYKPEWAWVGYDVNYWIKDL